MSTASQGFTSNAYPLPGLSQDVEVLIDRWGIPHIYAATRIDAYMAQGFQAARDRLFQIDLWRRRGLGLLSEVLGQDHVAQDRATRLFLFRGDMRAEWLAYSTDAKEVVTAFVAGVNAFVDWALRDARSRLPPEFGVLGYQPDRWQPEDIVRIRTHGLLYNVEQELARALTVRDLGHTAEELRSVREPATPLPAVDPGLFDDLTDAVLDVYRLAFAPVSFGATTSSAPSMPTGSNNWVIAPSLTTSGRPVLANDPHRALTFPSLRYLAHLEAPGLSVIGAGEPQLPGISIGHNDKIAFGLTIWPADQEDIYLYELHPEDDTRYSYRGAWEQFELLHEHASVAGGEHVVHRLAFTRHGPVVFVDTIARKAAAVRAAWLEPGMAPYLASLEYQGAQDATEFRRALRRWGAPAVNQVFATTEGDIGWQASGLLPLRPGWDGSMPVPGDGRFEWDGFAEAEALPSALNPASGWFTSSNENNLPPGHEDSVALTATTDWYSSARHERLVQWFESGLSLDVISSAGMQSNSDNHHGLKLLDALATVFVPDAVADEWAQLQDWDGAESVDSRAALVFQVWQRRHLRPWLVDATLARLAVAPEVSARSRHRLLRMDTLFSDLRPDLRMIAGFDLSDESDLAQLSAGVGTTLAAATDEIAKLLGSDQASWTWGALHRTELRHAVFSQAAEVPTEWGTLDDIPRAGSGDTVGLSGYDENFKAVMGSSFRIVVDVGEWDNTLVVNTPGQAGDPRSPHYSDLLSTWGADETFPLVYSRAAVDEAAVMRITLKAGDECRLP